jgi:hypothetical protein
MNENKTTPAEQNDAIRERVNREMPRPVGGFESSEQEDEFRAAHEARFMELVQNQ